ncbi:MAG: sensor histidine kinase [Opitutaceae bacterium]
MKLSHEWTLLLYALASGLPAVVLAFVLLARSGAEPDLRISAGVLVVLCWIGFAAAVRARAVRPLQTMANLLMALREGDFTFRARNARHGDALGEVLVEINSLGDLLQSQRRGAAEAAALLRTVMAAIDVAIFAFDERGLLRLANRAGGELLRERPEHLLGRPAALLGLAECLEGERARVLERTVFPGGRGRWAMRRTGFREEGRAHRLVVITDLSQPLREEELQAWQRLVRVLGHELNNSLAPIKSIAGSLAESLRRGERTPEWEADLRSGLDIIESRASGLARFLQAYSELARLPPPAPSRFEMGAVVRRVAALEARLLVAVEPGPRTELRADMAQVEHALINLVKNAAEAALAQRNAGRADAGVRVGWRRTRRGAVEVRVEDDGPGLAQTANLFVPFFTTKPEGSGIGLVLCRRIAENHGGSLDLGNRTDAEGCVALLRLPIAAAEASNLLER